MKKKLSALIACVLVSMLALAACGGGGGSTPPPSGGDTPPAEGTAPAPSDEKTVELNLHHHDPPSSATGRFLDAWAAKVQEASGGSLKINVYHGATLGTAKDTVDMVLNGTCDIGWGLPAFFPGRFPMTEVMAMPMMGIETAAQGSAALWELYSTTDFLQKEYDQFHVLLLHTNCDSPISTKGKVINSIADIKGMGIRANSGPPTEFVKRLGATPVSIVIGELYSSIEKGVLDAVITDWHALYSFKLYEQINNYLNEHIHVSPYFLLMNKDVYNSLSDNQKKALDDNSGTAALELAGDTWDEMTKMVGDIIAEKGYNLYELPPAEHDKMRAIAEQTWADWVTARTAEGYDAQAVLDKAVELVAKNK